MVPKLFMYCYWVWTWALLYLIGFARPSPMLSSLIILIFTFYNQFFSRLKDVYNLDFKISIVLIELFVFLLLFYFSGAFDFSNMSFSISLFFKDIYYNILIFSIYLLVLHKNNKTFHKIYFEEVPKQMENRGNIFKYLYKRFFGTDNNNNNNINNNSDLLNKNKN